MINKKHFTAIYQINNPKINTPGRKKHISKSTIETPEQTVKFSQSL